MTTIPIGRGAYRRDYSGSPEIQLVNRWVESNPTNLREGTAVLSRPGTTVLKTLGVGSWTGLSPIRGVYSLGGLFSDSLFVVSGTNLYRIAKDMTVTLISGVINGTGRPEIAWQKGVGYERLWIADGLLLQYYSGTTYASGILTKTGTIVNGTDKINIGGVYYTFGTVFNAGDAGTSANPFVVNPLTNPMNQLIKAINGSGVAGTDYSSTLGGGNTYVNATANDTLTPTLSIKVIADVQGTGGNSIATTIVGGTALSWGATTLQNGGIEALTGCTVPDGQIPLSITQTSSYILFSIANTQKFYWINPGETTVNALNFASKESSPDNIVAMRAIGDQVGIIGDRSFENWYATGNSTTPFAPIEGRVYARGALQGTATVVDQGIFLVGDDGRVYSIGSQSGDGTDAGWGVQRISDNGIEERVRRQVRREGGLTP